MAYSLVQHLNYNVWANERIGHLLMAQNDSILDAEQKSSFPTIRKTVFHIWDAEVIWLTRLKGGSLSDWPSKSFTGSKSDMLHGFIKNSTTLLTFVKEKGETFLDQTILYKNMKGDPYESSVEEILFHVVNHGTYHRGQITTLLHGAGTKQMVSTDMINWFREQRKKA
jgi:uncharacterized damage-inducible protein DinB